MLRAALRGRHTALGATRAASAALGAKRNYSAKLACLDLEGVLIPEVRMSVHRERRRRAQPMRSRARRCG